MSQVRTLLETTQAQPGRVDRANGIVFNVKVQGATSQNSHGEAVSGTIYTAEALRAAVPLYENVHVSVNHLPRHSQAEGYSAENRLGKLVNARFENGEIYADLHVLLSHPLAERLLEAAERMPDCFALSHNAEGKTEIRDGKLVVTEIKEVRSVDVVADGGGNKSLFESLHMSKQTTLRKIVQAMAVGRRARYRKLVEAMGDQPMEDAGEDAGWESHLCNMAAAIFGDESLSPDEKKKKLMAALKMSESSEDEDKDTEESEEDDGVPSKKKQKDEDMEEAEEQPIPTGTGLGNSSGVKFEKPKRNQTATKVTGESRKHRADPQVKALQERLDRADLKEWIRSRCEAKHLPCGARLLESLLALKQRDLIDDHLDLLLSLGVPATKSRTSAPRSSSPYRPLQESDRSAGSAEEFASLLLS